MEAPAAMAKDTNHIALDSIQEVYKSPDISLCFEVVLESERIAIPPELQKHLERAVAAWVRQRKQNWAKDIDVEDNAKNHIASISALYSPKDYPERPYYLYFGLSVPYGDNFSSLYIHIRFRKLDSLNDIERMLKSIKLKVQ
jgi:hypothetical protein